MDEYSPKRHDMAQLKFLCESLYHDCLATLGENQHEEDAALIEQLDEYLDDTFMLFSNYGINAQDLQKWRKSGNRLFRCFVNASRENPVSLSF